MKKLILVLLILAFAPSLYGISVPYLYYHLKSDTIWNRTANSPIYMGSIATDTLFKRLQTNLVFGSPVLFTTLLDSTHFINAGIAWSDLSAGVASGITATKVTAAVTADSAIAIDTSRASVRAAIDLRIKNQAEIFNKIDTCDAVIDSAVGAERAEAAKTVLWTWLYTFLDSTHATIPIADSVAGAWIRNFIDSLTQVKIPTADSATGALRASLLIAPQGSANTFGRMNGDTANIDTIHAKRVAADTTVSGTTRTNTIVSEDGNGVTMGTGTDSGYIQANDTAYVYHIADTNKIIWKAELRRNLGGDSIVVNLPAEWAGSVLFQGVGADTSWPGKCPLKDTVTANGNAVVFSDTISGSTKHKRFMQVSIMVPYDADSLRHVSLPAHNGASGDSTFVRLRFHPSPFDSAATLVRVGYGADSTNSSTLDTLDVAGSWAVTPGSMVYALIEWFSMDITSVTSKAFAFQLRFVFSRAGF